MREFTRAFAEGNGVPADGAGPSLLDRWIGWNAEGFRESPVKPRPRARAIPQQTGRPLPGTRT